MRFFIFFPFYYIHLKGSKTLDHILHKIRKHFKLHLHALSIDVRWNGERLYEQIAIKLNLRAPNHATDCKHYFQIEPTCWSKLTKYRVTVLFGDVLLVNYTLIFNMFRDILFYFCCCAHIGPLNYVLNLS